MLNAPDFSAHGGGFCVGRMDERRDVGRGPEKEASAEAVRRKVPGLTG